MGESESSCFRKIIFQIITSKQPLNLQKMKGFCLKIGLLISFMFAVAVSLSAQTNFIDSLRHVEETANNDTVRYQQFDILSIVYAETKPDSSLHYAQKALEIARDLKLKLNEALMLGRIGYAQQNMGNYPR